MDKRFPSPETIRALQRQLQNGVTVEEQETINELRKVTGGTLLEQGNLF